MLTKYRKILEEEKVRLQILNTAKKRFSREVSELEKELDILQKTRDVFKKAAVLTQNHLAEHLSSIVTKSLRMIWSESNLSFHTEFVERRNSTECDMWIEEDGHRYSLLDGKGYGIVDVVSFSLKVAYIILHNVDNIMIVDEPFRNVSKGNHEVLSRLVKELAEELEIQFIMSTHSTDLIAHSDQSFYIVDGSLRN